MDKKNEASPTGGEKFTYSKNAEPFVPSFMRAQAQTSAAPAPPTPVGIEDALSQGGSMDTGAPPATPSMPIQWDMYFKKMSPDDVDMLFDLLPGNVQFMYDNVLDQYNEQRDSASKQKSGASKQNKQKKQNPKISAAIETFRNLNPDQLEEIQNILQSVSDDASFPYAGDNMFDDANMNAEEEEWLIDQMMKGGDAKEH